MIFSLTALIVLMVYIVNVITPFIIYQKLQMIATKYMYVIEKYGYLTDNEEKMLYSDLAKEGFEKNKIQTNFPNAKQDYGTLFSFEIKYEYEQEFSVFSYGIKKEVRTIPLHIKKYSYSKV